MKLKIKKTGVDKRRRTPHYVVSFEFMEGDADGEQNDEVEFDVDETDNMEKLILALACCNAAYPKGRGGYDEYNGLPEYDAYFCEDNCDEEGNRSKEHIKLNPNDIYIEHPSDSNYLTTSFRGYDVTFIDEHGDSSGVKITFNKEEKARIERSENWF